jgi:hypothetical protein
MTCPRCCIVSAIRISASARCRFANFAKFFAASNRGRTICSAMPARATGHAVFYGASVANCRFRAVEILPQRCNAMRKTAKRLGLDVEIVQGDALAQSYADVSYLFVNSPFFPDAAKRFADGLKARTGPLTVIAVHNIVDAFRADHDFVETEVAADLPNYCFGVFNWKKRGKGRRDDAHMPRR